MGIKDLSGKRFGYLTAIQYTGKKTKSGHNAIWLCKCDCGNYVEVNSGQLQSSGIHSCGCYVRERMSKLNYKHGGKKERLYMVWESIKRRCYDKSFPEYDNYGGRGISVCNDFMDYAKFREWALANGYDKNAKQQMCTIDRIDVNGNYTPENCRWVSAKVQQNNRRNNRIITYKGETHTLAEWNRIKNFPTDTIGKRLSSGWTLDRAIEAPLDYSRHPKMRNKNK